MSLQFNAAEARKGDSYSSIIKETGKYVGVLTRAEKLVSSQGTKGVGLSFKSDDGASASYLDVYTHRADGSALWGANIIQALLCCVGVKDAAEGPITFDKWDKEVGEVVKTTAPGYPALMGKRIGLLLQRELATNDKTGADTDRMNIVSVFQAATGLTSSEILDNKTKPEKIEQRLKALTPVYDKRKKKGAAPAASAPVLADGDPGFDDFDKIRF